MARTGPSAENMCTVGKGKWKKGLLKSRALSRTLSRSKDVLVIFAH